MENIATQLDKKNYELKIYVSAPIQINFVQTVANLHQINLKFQNSLIMFLIRAPVTKITAGRDNPNIESIVKRFYHLPNAINPNVLKAIEKNLGVSP